MRRGRRRAERVVSIAGFAAGIALVVVALLHWRVPLGTGTVGADVYVVAPPTGELAVSPTGYALHRAGLRPGSSRGPASVIRLRNITGRTLLVRMRATVDQHGLDALVRVEVESGGETLYDGTLRSLRSWTQRSFTIRSAETRTLDVRAWLPESVGGGYEGMVTTATTDFRATPIGAGG